ncbi:hypothetical protein C8F01DRAFT_664401 [Mycena amicta]|nr:hypothetical protein C8F01DRAFT_664401 [Mycena amicta]
MRQRSILKVTLAHQCLPRREGEVSSSQKSRGQGLSSPRFTGKLRLIVLVPLTQFSRSFALARPPALFTNALGLSASHVETFLGFATHHSPHCTHTLCQFFEHIIQRIHLFIVSRPTRPRLESPPPNALTGPVSEDEIQDLHHRIASAQDELGDLSLAIRPLLARQAELQASIRSRIPRLIAAGLRNLPPENSRRDFCPLCRHGAPSIPPPQRAPWRNSHLLVLEGDCAKDATIWCNFHYMAWT